MLKKVCMLGSFAVGKTSLVRRFVSGVFSARYQTTVGVKIDRKTVDVDGEEVTLVLWDLYGEDEFQKIRETYVRGSSGLFLVVDSTRPDTLDVAKGLLETMREIVGDAPFALLVNKSDLVDECAIDPAALECLTQGGWTIVRTSAKTGIGVEDAFRELAQRMVCTD